MEQTQRDALVEEMCSRCRLKPKCNEYVHQRALEEGDCPSYAR
jgi:hypothetical protein